MRDIAELSAPTRHLIRISMALHGGRWQRPIARDLGVNSRTIVRWLHGQGRPTIDDLRGLVAVARQRCVDITAAVEASACLTYRPPKWAARAPEKQIPKKAPVPQPAIYGGPPLPPWKQG